MALIKNPDADIRKSWKLWTEVSAVATLALMIMAFVFFPDLKNQVVLKSEVQEVVKVEEIEVTKQEVKPPPPPRPQVPVMVPNDQVMEDEVVYDSELKVEDTPPPPPPVAAAEEEEATIFEVVEDQPEPIGGIGAIQSKVVYPEIAKKAGIEGTVVIRAAIDEKGNVIKTVIAKGIGAGCDEAAVEAIRKVKFKPGSQRGKPVKVWLSIPIRFKLK
ncbi:MAG: energy transducer TonB [Bacteroidetes bacterium]|nr:energy transducer TonB [Bacteroidota bacterium]